MAGCKSRASLDGITPTNPQEASDYRANSLKESLEENTYANKLKFIVRVLTRPQNLNGPAPNSSETQIERSNSVMTGTDAEKRTQYIFKGRIVDEDVLSPHLMLTDPCDLDVLDPNIDNSTILNMINAHLTCITKMGYEGEIPKIGDRVEVTLSPGHVGPYDLQYCYIDSIEFLASYTDDTTRRSLCLDNLKDLFTFPSPAPAANPPQPRNPPTPQPAPAPTPAPSPPDPNLTPPLSTKFRLSNPEWSNDSFTAYKASMQTIATRLGEDQNAFYTPMNRSPKDIQTIVMHSTAGPTGDGKARSGNHRMATAPTHAFVWTAPDGTSDELLDKAAGRGGGSRRGNKITNPKCDVYKEITGEDIPNSAGRSKLICNPAVNRIHVAGKASVHYFVDQGGNVVQGVLEKDYAWHAGDSTIGKKSIGIEMCGHPDKGEGDGFEGKFCKMYDENLIKTVCKLVAEICYRNDIEVNRTNIIGHYEYQPHRRSDPGINKPADLKKPNVACSDKKRSTIRQGPYDEDTKCRKEGSYWDWDRFIELVKEQREKIDSEGKATWEQTYNVSLDPDVSDPTTT